MLWARNRRQPEAAAAASRFAGPLGPHAVIAVPEVRKLLQLVRQVCQLVHDQIWLEPGHRLGQAGTNRTPITPLAPATKIRTGYSSYPQSLRLKHPCGRS